MSDSVQTAEATFFLGDTPLAVSGQRLAVGQPAPDVCIADGWITETNLLASTAGKVRLISVIPCIHTHVCDAQTRRMNQEASRLGEDVVVIGVSTDPPPVQGIWCGAAGVDRVVMLSDHRAMAFGYAYGTAVEAMRADQRALFVVDQNDVVRYAEYVHTIGDQPDYAAALTVVRGLLA